MPINFIQVIELRTQCSSNIVQFCIILMCKSASLTKNQQPDKALGKLAFCHFSSKVLLDRALQQDHVWCVSEGACSPSGYAFPEHDLCICLHQTCPDVMLGMCWGLRLMRCCRSWLRDARSGVTSADEAAPLLQNPLRNGVLLCDLAGNACTRRCCCLQTVHCKHQFLCVA